MDAIFKPHLGEKVGCSRGTFTFMHRTFHHGHLDVFRSRQSGKEVKRLEDKANLPGAEIGEVAHSGESLPTEKDFSGIGAVQSAEHLEEDARANDATASKRRAGRRRSEDASARVGAAATGEERDEDVEGRRGGSGGSLISMEMFMWCFYGQVSGSA